MGVDARFPSLFQNLRLQDPWVPPSTWESVTSESGLRPSSTSPYSSSLSDQPLSALSESSLVRLATNAMQGVKSSVLSIQQLSALFCSDPADRTFHHISSLWNRASSTRSLGNLLTSIGSTGSLVILIREFVGYFTSMNLQSENYQESPPYSLVNQAFAVAVGKVLEGYLCGLDTVHASIALRHSSKDVDFPASGCLKSVVHSEITLLEFYLHTKELRTWVEALASICNLQKWVLRFSEISLEELITEAKAEFCHYYRGGDLLTFLYAQLQVADTAHCTLLKFLFLQSCEPYCGFIRSWIFKAEIHDPYKEFIVENMECLPPESHLKAGNSVDFPSLTHIRVRDEVSIPGFLENFLVPLVRAGQQLQVLLKLVELCVHVTSGERSPEDFLPCWSGFSSSISSYSSPLTFSREVIDVMVNARENYYGRMNEKIDSLLSSLEVRYQRVATHASVSFDNVRGDLDKLGQLTEEDESIVRPTADKRSSNMDVDSMDSDASGRLPELSLLDDMYGSSESLSLNGSEEQLDFDQHYDWPCLTVGGQHHLSALSFSKGTTLNSSIQDSCHRDKPGSDSQGICDNIDASNHLIKSSQEGVISNHKSNPLNSGNSKCSSVFSIQYRYSMTDSFSEIGNLLNKSVDDHETTGQNITEKQSGSLGHSISCHDVITIKDNFIETATSEAQPDNNSFTSNLYTSLQKVGHKYKNPSVNLLSMNPMLTRNELLHWLDGSGERFKANYEHHLPYINFSAVENPCKVYMDKLPINSRITGASSFPLNRSASNYGNNITKYGEMGIGTEDGQAGIPKHCFDASLDLMDHKQDAVVSGGSTWERSLCSFSDTQNGGATHSQSFSSAFEMPLDIILDKCLLQEIMLQYKYVSKLTINVLEEVFELQEHLLALRRYHFMELADWADLFILSLWHHKWSVTEANERLPEVQGLLELAIQKSSCEQDPNKDRLFVYMKGHGKLPLSASAIGVRSFDFLGLGYRVDWPLSIVLTPAASKLYADIFNFLIRVKLAIFSLTDVWCSLKDLVHTTDKDLNSELLHQDETRHLNVLTMMRHQINHFVSTLQQYVESQLSHVSWCKLLHSLQHKVKDMMDLESVHMEYLTDSLCICFLSDETRAVGGIIESILQCALDFRSCLTVGVWRTGSSQENLSGRLSKINIPQVLSIKQKFDRSLKELHICYIKEPKHGKFGRHFWESLDYNRYYSHVINEMGQYGL